MPGWIVIMMDMTLWRVRQPKLDFDTSNIRDDPSDLSAHHSTGNNRKRAGSQGAFTLKMSQPRHALTMSPHSP
jgi:hypothetical protein